MKALLWTAPEQIEMAERERPVPAPDEVLIRVDVVGICGSEIEGYLGHNSLRVPPLVMGHEFSGTIEQGAGDVRPGQRVVVNPLTGCGECRVCRRGLRQLCKHRQIIGIHRPGAFAEWVVAPVRNVIAIPDSLPSHRAALSEPLACSLRATRRALARHPFGQVLVFGAGGIGILCAKVARVLGASTIAVADTNEQRLRIAKEVAADIVVNPREPGWEERLLRGMGEQGIDAVIDAAGFQPTREAAVRLVNAGGTVMNIGLGIDDTRLPVNHLIRSEIDILGSFSYTDEDFRNAVDLLIRGTVTETGWTETRPLSEGPGAFRDLVAGRVTNGKIFLDVAGE
ncbi:MAG: galactitol-1-phosphate 5-dehydrogenase [Alicyclobacillus sp.]|nr:galactitol-1-phosphate 5-dehydrogenase [Alicyclobacillus sp.]